MIHVVWTFIVKPSALAEFQRAYGPDGPWSRLFREHPGYLGTTLWRDTGDSRRFMTVDVWASGRQRERMLTEARAEYIALDRVLADLIEREEEVGVFSFPAASAGSIRRIND